MSLFQHILKVGTGSVVGQLLVVASAPVLTRLYSPEAYAYWAVFLSVSVIFSGVATLRFELAVVLPPDRSEAASLVVLGAFCTVVVGALGLVLIWITGEHWVGTALLPVLKPWFIAMPVFVIASGLYQLANAWCTREEAFGVYGFAQFLLPAVTVVSQVGMGLAGWHSSGGLIAGTLLGQVLATGLLASVLWRRNHREFRNAATQASLRASAVKYRRYPFFMTPYTLVGIVRDRLAYFLLGRFGTQTETGHYSLSARMVNLPNSLISSAVRPVFFQYAAGRDMRTLETPMLATIRALGLAVVPFWAVFLVHAKTLFGWIFSPAWSEAGYYAMALSVPAMALMLGNWADRSFDVLWRQRTAFALELVFSLVSIVGLVAGYALFRNLFLAVCLQSTVLTVYYITWLFVLFHLAGFQLIALVRVLLMLVMWLAVNYGLAWFLARGLSAPIAIGLSLGVAAVFVIVSLHHAYVRFRITHSAASA